MTSQYGKMMAQHTLLSSTWSPPVKAEISQAFKMLY